MVQNQYDVIVIGAGHNGLVTAGYLAKDGLSVLVLERLEKVGGACTTEQLFPGFYGPMCARICDMLQGKVIDDLDLRSHGFEIARPPASLGQGRRFHPFPDGTYLGGPGIDGPLAFADQIRQFSERDAAAFFRWGAFWDQAAAMLAPYYLTEPPTIAQLVEDTRSTEQEEVLERLLTWSLVDLLEHHFEDERVKANFMSPSESDPTAPGSLMSLAYFRAGAALARSEDQGTPRGNMGAITTAMAAAAEGFGAVIRTGAIVREIIVEDGSARGVRLAGGDEIRSSLVVSNADPKRTFSTLVRPEDAPDDVRRAKGMKTRVSSLVFSAALSELPDFSRYLGADYDRRSVPDPIIAPSVDYYLSAWSDTINGGWPRSPILAIRIPSVFDPSIVPKDRHLFTIWSTYQPPKLKEGTWDDARNDVGEYIIDLVSEYAPNFRSSIIDWSLQTPTDIEARTGLTDGSIHHVDATPDQLHSQRQPYRTQIGGFYLCGAGTHPGGEVTGAPGHNCAQAILSDIARPAD